MVIEERADGDHINLGTISHAHRHFVLRQPPFIQQFLFRVANVSNRTGIKYPGTTTRVGKVHINNMYITYTFVVVGPLLVRQILGAVPLPVAIPLAIETLSLWLGPSLGFLHWISNCFATLLRVTLLALAILLETGGFIDHQHLILLLDLCLRDFQHRKQLGDGFIHPLHVVLLHEALVAWRE